MVAPFRSPRPSTPVLPRGCVRCGRDRVGWCRRCRRECDPPPEAPVALLGDVVALVAYDGAGAHLISALKHRDGRRAIPVIADDLAAQIGALGPGWMVTWAPTSARRRRRRGYDQSELLARALARRLDRPCRRLLDRAPGSGTQTGRGRSERLGGVAFAPTRTARRQSAVPDGGVLLVDDVCTTGATLRAATATLADLGWRQVRPIVVARTP